MVENHSALHWPKGQDGAGMLKLRTYFCDECNTALETYDLDGVDDNFIVDHMEDQFGHKVEGTAVICHQCLCHKEQE